MISRSVWQNPDKQEPIRTLGFSTGLRCHTIEGSYSLSFGRRRLLHHRQSLMENSLRSLPTEKKSLTARKSTTSLLLASQGGTNSKKNKTKQNKNKTRISGEKIARTPRFMGKRKVRSRAFVISVRPYHDKFSKKTEDNKLTPIHISLILNFQLNSLRKKASFLTKP